MSDKNELPSGEAESVTLALNPADIPFATGGVEGPTLFADAIRGTSIMAGVVRLNLVEYKPDFLDSVLKAKHVATLALPAEQVRAWAEFLHKLADGLLPPAPGGEEASVSS